MPVLISKVSDTYHTACFLNREPSNITFDITYHNGYQNSPQERQVAMRKKQQAEWLDIRRQMTDDPEQCMELLLNWRGLKYTELGDAIDRDPKTISRTVKDHVTLTGIHAFAFSSAVRFKISTIRYFQHTYVPPPFAWLSIFSLTSCF